MWAVLISWGITFPDVTTKTYKVRCVSGAAEPRADYTDNIDGTVTDNVTGLMWEQKTDDGGPGIRIIHIPGKTHWHIVKILC